MHNLFADQNLIKVLKEGGVAVIPTDTLYGVVASAMNQPAVEKIYDIRQRNPEKACIILIADIADIAKFSINLSQEQKKILRGYWQEETYGPDDKRGAVSIIMPCEDNNFEYLHRGTNTLAFRVPALEDLRYLLATTGPLVAPSANIEGLDPAKTIEEAKKYFGDRVDLYIDEGRISSPASKLIKLHSDGSVEVLRP